MTKVFNVVTTEKSVWVCSDCTPGSTTREKREYLEEKYDAFVQSFNVEDDPELFEAPFNTCSECGRELI